MGLDSEEDRKRTCVELNLRAARKRQSPQTGFVHYCYEADAERHDTIPLFENFCFILALLRSKVSENMLEAIALLQKLLAFEHEGNFPVYLHEFPTCKDRFLSIRLLVVFKPVFADFHAIFDTSLQNRLCELMQKITNFGHAALDGGILPCRYGLYLNFDSTFEPQSPEQIAAILSAAQMTNHSGMREKMAKQWHGQLMTYMGPQEQEKTEPKLTLSDLWMSDYFKNFPPRVMQEHPVHLRASLVYPFEEQRSPLPQLKIPHAVSSAHPRQPFTLYWGDCHQLHSLVPDPKETACRIVQHENAAEFFFTCTLPASQERSFEMAFFCNLHPDHTFFINGCKATTFKLDDAVEIHSGNMRCRIVFSLIEGEGIFFGHLSRSNRPLQVAAKGRFVHDAFDWQIGIRTIRRSDQCVLRALLSWSN